MNRIRRFIASLRPTHQLPAPDPRCKSYDFGGLVQLIRNHDTARRISAAHH